MELAIGDLVVYGSHGVGRVTSRHANGERVLVKLELPEGLSVTLRLESAAEVLRPVSSETELDDVRRALLDADADIEDVWRRRIKLTEEKLRNGAAIGLAEVVRDGAHRDRDAARGAVRLSLGERQMYLKARRLLAAEVGFSLGVEPSEGEAWIADHLDVATGEAAPAAVGGPA